MFTDSDLTAATHEAAHAAMAILQGLRVERVTIDRHGELLDNVGECATSFLPDDQRSAAEKAAARARVSLAGVRIAPGKARQADADVAAANTWAGVARADDADAWIAARSDETQETIDTDAFRMILDEISYALLAGRTLDEADVTQALRLVPGATTAALRAREAAGIPRATL